MAPKHHPTPLSGDDRKALSKELGKARAMTGILAAQSVEMRVKAETMLQQADRLLCESWNERMWSDGEPIDPSPTIDQAINSGFSWLEIRCSRCKTPSDVRALQHPSRQARPPLQARRHSSAGRVRLPAVISAPHAPVTGWFTDKKAMPEMVMATGYC
jgi:hypothetical protein